jgi:hypothetical protein
MIWLVDADVKLGAAIQRGALGVALVPLHDVVAAPRLICGPASIFSVISFLRFLLNCYLSNIQKLFQ